MSYLSDKAAYTLNEYFRPISITGQKYEKGSCAITPFKWLMLAQTLDHSHPYTKINAELNYTFPYEVAGTLDPDSTGLYRAESSYKDKPSYVDKTREWFIWWDGIDSWIISDAVGFLGDAYWSQTSTVILGEYAPQGDATGTATVGLGPAPDYNVKGATTPDTWGNYYEEGTLNGKTYYRRVDGFWYIFWDGIDSWLISDWPELLDNPYWKRTDPAIAGDYLPQNRAIGTVTIAAGAY